MTGKAKGLTALLVALILGIVFGFDAFKKNMIAKRLAAFTPPPVAVTTTQASTEQWTTRFAAVGQVTAKSGVDVTTQIAGQVRKISFQSGDIVAEGQLLVQLDDRLLQDQLQRDNAEKKLARLEADRYKTLVKDSSASQANLDRAMAHLASTTAAQEATANQIDFMAIKAPFAGRVGIREVNVGEFLQPGATVVNLQNSEILFVDFSLPEADLPLLKKKLKVEVTSEAFPDRTFEAFIIAVSPQVDPNSRNLDLRAQIVPGDKGLVPGMYVDVSVVTEQQRELVTLPAVAVSYSLYGNTVFVVGAQDGENHKVERRDVDLVIQRNSKVGISKGLKPGDQVVTSNQQQLNNKSLIRINNDDVKFTAAARDAKQR